MKGEGDRALTFRRRKADPVGLARDLGWPDHVHACEIAHGDPLLLMDNRACWPLAVRRAGRVRQLDYAAGRWCARHALERAGCPQVGELPMGDDRLPCWPEGLTGSISHTREGAVAVVSEANRCIALGIDMETWVDESVGREIREQVGIEAEWARLAGYTPAEATTLLFSAKEAVFKALYPQTRRIMEFHAVRLASVDANGMQLSLTCQWSPHWTEGKSIDVDVVVDDVHVYCGVYIPARDSLEKATS